MIRWRPWLVHPLALLQLAWMVFDGFTNNLTANPIQELTHRTGKTALILLVLTLSITPVRRFVLGSLPKKLRQPLGLYAFLYASLHLLIYVVLDYYFDWQLLWQELGEKLYVLAGFGTWLLLLPLAITSTKGWKRRLGRKWPLLHKLIYLAAGTVVLHYTWLVKSDIREPLAYGAVLLILLLARWSYVRNILSSLKRSGKTVKA